ncbi:MAG TPA: tetratricopeptide repeat protein, partial [Ignavibacteria bacterium]|nr:tetratricopeptide repeat protein [Ignavibacteria bacterium]
AIAILYFTNNFEIVYNDTKEKLNSFSLVAISGIIILFIWDILKSQISEFIRHEIFPPKKAELKEIQEHQEEHDKKLNEILERINFDPGKLQPFIKELSNFSRIDEQKKVVIRLYKSNRIDGKEKETLLLMIDFKHQNIEKLNKEIYKYKQQGNTEYAQLLGNLKDFLKNADHKGIKQNYFKFKEQQKQTNIDFLKQSIKATTQLFAYEDTKELYEELIHLEPTGSNHFDFAYFLQRFNYFNEAIKHYEEALKTYRELAKENPGTYLPDVAMTLNNLANLHSDKNEFPQALEKYEEALKIRRELAKENPRRYEIDYAKTLIMGVDLFGKDKKDLKQAKEILLKYKGIPLADNSLAIIEKFENE